MTNYVDKRLDDSKSVILTKKFKTPNVVLKMFRKPPKSPSVKQVKAKVQKISKMKPKTSYKFSRIKKF